jgi:hypothetical protein
VIGGDAGDAVDDRIYGREEGEDDDVREVFTPGRCGWNVIGILVKGQPSVVLSS